MLCAFLGTTIWGGAGGGTRQSTLLHCSSLPALTRLGATQHLRREQFKCRLLLLQIFRLGVVNDDPQLLFVIHDIDAVDEDLIAHIGLQGASHLELSGCRQNFVIAGEDEVTHTASEIRHHDPFAGSRKQDLLQAFANMEIFVYGGDGAVWRESKRKV